MDLSRDSRRCRQGIFFFTPNITNPCRIFQKNVDIFLPELPLKISRQQFFFFEPVKRDTDVHSESYVVYGG